MLEFLENLSVSFWFCFFHESFDAFRNKLRRLFFSDQPEDRRANLMPKKVGSSHFSAGDGRTQTDPIWQKDTSNGLRDQLSLPLNLVMVMRSSLNNLKSIILERKIIPNWKHLSHHSSQESQQIESKHADIS
ncbi:hypothetical protein CRENBAI_008590 [Crenichthys baileyi]|uniref:Uncharacterized protein n=1 Tax=Crenichthys baileyi TaxID=28760 RepID=A0AAV9RZ83_9TELE